MHRGIDPAAMARLGQRSETLGFGRMWIPELLGFDALIGSHAVIQVTSTLEVAPIVSLQARSDLSTAAGLATLAATAPGRVLAGVGVTNRAAAAWHDRAWEPPAVRLERAIRTLRQLWRGERIDEQRRVRLLAPPVEAVPLYVAALGPKALDAASRFADGLLVNMVPPATAANLAGRFRDGDGNRPVNAIIRVAQDLDGGQRKSRDEFEAELQSYVRAPGYSSVLTDIDPGEQVLEWGRDRIYAPSPKAGQRLVELFEEQRIDPVILPMVSRTDPDPEATVGHVLAGIVAP